MYKLKTVATKHPDYEKFRAMVANLQLAGPLALSTGCIETYRLIQTALEKSGYEFAERLEKKKK